MRFEDYIGGADTTSAEWQQAKQKLIEHLDTCPLCRAHAECVEAVSILTRLAKRSQ
jgi:hypothetical protein